MNCIGNFHWDLLCSSRYFTAGRISRWKRMQNGSSIKRYNWNIWFPNSSRRFSCIRATSKSRCKFRPEIINLIFGTFGRGCSRRSHLPLSLWVFLSTLFGLGSAPTRVADEMPMMTELLLIFVTDLLKRIMLIYCVNRQCQSNRRTFRLDFRLSGNFCVTLPYGYSG